MTNQAIINLCEDILEALRTIDFFTWKKCTFLYEWGCRVSELEAITRTGIFDNNGNLHYIQPKTKKERILQTRITDSLDQNVFKLNVLEYNTRARRNGDIDLKKIGFTFRNRLRKNFCMFHIFRYGYIAKQYVNGLQEVEIARDLSVSIGVLKGYAQRITEA